MDVPEKTPEVVAAELEVAIADAMQPLRDGADRLEAGAAELRAAADRADTAKAMEIGTDLLAEHVRFAKVFRTWLGNRPDRPLWRSAVADAPLPVPVQPSASPGSDRDDRMSV